MAQLCYVTLCYGPSLPPSWRVPGTQFMRHQRLSLLPLLLHPARALQLGWCGSAGEVVGASGRIGSLLLRSGGGRLAAVPRGLAPGCLSPPGTPILVTAPADALDDVLRATPPARREDLVLLCNGMAQQRAAEVLGESAAAEITAGCLFFGVLASGAEPTFGPGAPRTALAGRHAETTAALIERMGPQCEVLPTLDDLAPVAQLKMLWGAAMWLLCAARGCTVSEVHLRHGAELAALVEELLAECDPSLSRRPDAVLASLRAYSDSMPSVVPSKALAEAELMGRNGWFLRAAARARRAQPRHRALLREVRVAAPPEETLLEEEDEAEVGSGARAEAEASPRAAKAAPGEGGAASLDACGALEQPRPPPVLWRHGFGLLAAPRPAPPPPAPSTEEAAAPPLRPAPRAAVVVGAGIVGCAAALELARRGLRVARAGETGLMGVPGGARASRSAASAARRLAAAISARVCSRAAGDGLGPEARPRWLSTVGTPPPNYPVRR